MGQSMTKQEQAKTGSRPIRPAHRPTRPVYPAQHLAYHPVRHLARRLLAIFVTLTMVSSMIPQNVWALNFKEQGGVASAAISAQSPSLGATRAAHEADAQSESATNPDDLFGSSSGSSDGGQGSASSSGSQGEGGSGSAFVDPNDLIKPANPLAPNASSTNPDDLVTPCSGSSASSGSSSPSGSSAAGTAGSGGYASLGANLSTVYVGGLNANDSSGTGSQAQPFATLAKALDEAATTATIYLLGDVAINTPSVVKAGSTITITKAPTLPAAEEISLYRYEDSLGATTHYGYLLSVEPTAILTTENIIIDGKQIEDASPAVYLRGAYHAHNTVIKDNYSKYDGGAIFMNTGVTSAAFVMTGGMITGNLAYDAAKGQAQKGAGIFFGNGTVTVGADARIGDNAQDNGIYLYENTRSITIAQGGLNTDAFIVFEGTGSTRSGVIVATKVPGSGNASATEAGVMHWRNIAYSIEPVPDARTYKLVRDADEFYVAADNAPIGGLVTNPGNDDTGTGTQQYPFASLAKAFAETPMDEDGNTIFAINLLTSITIRETAPVRSNADLVVKPASGATNISVTRFGGGGGQATFTDPFISVLSQGKLTINDITWDGNAISGADSLFSVNGGTLVMNSGLITRNYVTQYGGGLSITNNGTFEMRGGRITGNYANAVRGGDVYFYSGSFSLSGDVYVGTPSLGRGVWVENGRAFTVAADLTSASRAYIEAIVTTDDPTGKNPADGTLVAVRPDGGISDQEARHFIWFGLGKMVRAAAPNQYVIGDMNAFYVAAAGGEYGALDDISHDGSFQHPFASVDYAISRIIEPGQHTIILMESVDVPRAVTVASGKDIVIASWEDAQSDDYPAVLTRKVTGNLFTVSAGGTLSFGNVIVDGNRTTAAYAANNGALVNNAGTLYLNTGTILQNNVNAGAQATLGGALYNAGTLSISGALLRNNQAANGGALYIASGSALIQNSMFTNNSAVGTTVASGGGALYQNGGTLVLSDSTKIGRAHV
jgi:hypothetical protein